MRENAQQKTCAYLSQSYEIYHIWRRIHRKYSMHWFLSFVEYTHIYMIPSVHALTGQRNSDAPKPCFINIQVKFTACLRDKMLSKTFAYAWLDRDCARVCVWYFYCPRPLYCCVELIVDSFSKTVGIYKEMLLVHTQHGSDGDDFYGWIIWFRFTGTTLRLFH